MPRSLPARQTAHSTPITGSCWSDGVPNWTHRMMRVLENRLTRMERLCLSGLSCARRWSAWAPPPATARKDRYLKFLGRDYFLRLTSLYEHVLETLEAAG